MKNYRIVLSILFCVLSAQILFAQKSVKYDLPAFTEISLRNDAKLILKQDSSQSVTVMANEETIAKLIVEVKDRKLIIRYPANSWFDKKWAPGDLTVTVSVPQIDQLMVSGSGSIIAETPVSTRILDFYVSGSGSIKLSNLKAEKLTAGLSGSGHLQLAGPGTVSEFKMTVSGSGGVKAFGLRAKNVNVMISGSGSCSVNAIENLKCKVAGSGNVTYAGNPQVESTIVGSGSVKGSK
jgi:hypothetical protein